MRVGVAGRVSRQSVPWLLARCRGLALAGHGVVFRVGGDGRPLTIAIGRDERGGHTCTARLDAEARRLECLDIPRGGTVFP